MEEFHSRVKSMLRLLKRNYFNDRSLLTSLYGPGGWPIVCRESGGVGPGNYRSSPVTTATMVGVTGQWDRSGEIFHSRKYFITSP